MDDVIVDKSLDDIGLFSPGLVQLVGDGAPRATSLEVIPESPRVEVGFSTEWAEESVRTVVQRPPPPPPPPGRRALPLEEEVRKRSSEYKELLRLVQAAEAAERALWGLTEVNASEIRTLKEALGYATSSLSGSSLGLRIPTGTDAGFEPPRLCLDRL